MLFLFFTKKNTSGLDDASKKCGLFIGSFENERSILALSPCGGSFVILIAFSSIVTGNKLVEVVVSQSLKLVDRLSFCI
jgi:hypothetical protein